MWVCLGEYLFEDNFSRREPKFYNRLFNDYFETGQHKSVPDTVPFVNVHNRSTILYPNNANYN